MFALPVIAGFAIGAVFGVVGLLSGFCLMSSLRDWWTHDDGRKIRSYALAVAVAVFGTQFIAGAGSSRSRSRFICNRHSRRR
jgi:hypothetical protein